MPIRRRVLPPPIRTYADLAAATVARGDVFNIDMMKLREIHGAGKLGVHVAQSISDELKRRGMGHEPEVLPLHQSERVRIYMLGSAVGKLIEATRTIDVASNKILREAANNEARGIVRQIRDLVCE